MEHWVLLTADEQTRVLDDEGAVWTEGGGRRPASLSLMARGSHHLRNGGWRQSFLVERLCGGAAGSGHTRLRARLHPSPFPSTTDGPSRGQHLKPWHRNGIQRGQVTGSMRAVARNISSCCIMAADLNSIGRSENSAVLAKTRDWNSITHANT